MRFVAVWFAGMGRRRLTPKEAAASKERKRVMDRERCRAMRAKLKEDPEAWAEYQEAQRVSNQKSYANRSEFKKAYSKAYVRFSKSDNHKWRRLDLDVREGLAKDAARWYLAEKVRNPELRCWACGAPQHTKRHPHHVDHDHRTFVVRGLLCRECNLALGLLEDSPKRITSLLRYIEAANISPGPMVLD